MKRNVDPNFYRAEAALPPGLACYVPRQADDELLKALRDGKFTVILSSRKVGKSSLLERAFASLRGEGVCVMKKELAEADQGITEASWYGGLIEELVNDAKRRNGFEVDTAWRSWWKDRDLVPLGQRFTDFLRTFFLEQSNQPWVIAIDEIDTTIPLPFSDDFFAAIRRCQNARAGDPLFNRLTFLLAGVASPSQLIKDNRRTPFNIGYAVNLTDFTAEEAKVLLTGLGEPVADRHPALLRLLHWTGGHPFLTQKVFLRLAEQLEQSPRPRPDWKELVDQAVRETFLRAGARVTEPHLEDIARRRIGELDQRLNPNADPELKRKMLLLYQSALEEKLVKDEAQSKPCVELKLCGLLVPHAKDPSRLVVRNLIYRTVFDAAWVDTEMQLKADISRIIKYAPAALVGREAETKLLNDAWTKTQKHDAKHPHILTFVGLGGEGKTALVAKWAAELAHQDWPGCDVAFAWSFYSQGTREQLAASSDLFLKEALTFFGDAAMASSAQGAFEKGRRLAQLVGEQRALLILDGLEPLQYAPTSPTPGELKDQGIAALLKGLATNSRGLCVVTTRYSLPDLKAFRQTTAPEVPLLRLSREAGVHLLKVLGVNGSERRTLLLKDGDENSEKVNEFEKLVEDVKRHALTLILVGSYLNDAHGGDIRKRNLVKLGEADDEIQVIPDHPHHAFHVMDAYVEWFETGGKNEEENRKGLRALALLRLLGLFDRPATADSLNALWKGEAIAGLTESLVGLTDAQRNTALKRLDDAKLLTVNRDASGTLVSLDAHPHLREYFARQLRTQQPDAWRAAHRRLYKYLCAVTSDKPESRLEDLQPLYQAVAHGSQAGLQREAYEEVYLARIARGNEAYAVRKLGAFGSELAAVATFFDQPWNRVSSALTEASSARVLNQAAFHLRALGRLVEALEPMRAGQHMLIAQKDWELGSISSSNLSELELTLGEVAQALGDAEQSVIYADRSRDDSLRRSMRHTLGDALHQAGRRVEAENLFREAEQMQAILQPDYPLLYSLPGFRYCDLLFIASERAAWREVISRKAVDSKQKLSAVCRAVAGRAAQTLTWAEQQGFLLDIALDHLTLGRAALYEAILERCAAFTQLQRPTESAAPNDDGRRSGLEGAVETARRELDAAVDGLRRAGQQPYLPHSLLTRAWLRFLTGARTGPDSAQEDLDEAWEIAERGPMKLFMADIHLYRARLFHDVKLYPWATDADDNARGPKDDLAAARKLIEQCGYWRRKEELEDAEAAARDW